MRSRKTVVRAIEVSRAACKDEFRRNPRSHSWHFVTYTHCCSMLLYRIKDVILYRVYIYIMYQGMLYIHGTRYQVYMIYTCINSKSWKVERSHAPPWLRVFCRSLTRPQDGIIHPTSASTYMLLVPTCKLLVPCMYTHGISGTYMYEIW